MKKVTAWDIGVTAEQAAKATDNLLSSARNREANLEFLIDSLLS
jgi:hypothetical protein